MIERAAEAAHYAQGYDDYEVANQDKRIAAQEVARAVFESIDTDELARVIKANRGRAKRMEDGHLSYLYATDEEIAQAVKDYLTGSAR